MPGQREEKALTNYLITVIRHKTISFVFLQKMKSFQIGTQINITNSKVRERLFSETRMVKILAKTAAKTRIVSIYFIVWDIFVIDGVLGFWGER